MAMFDWNRNGDKNDMTDNFIEYQIYKSVTGQDNEPSYTPRRGDGISTLGVIISIIVGLFMQAALYTALEIDVADVPVIVILILWVVFSAITAVIADKIGL